MINNKIRKMFSPAAGLISAFMLMGTVSMPVYAADNNIQYAYNQKSLAKSELNGNNVIDQNGVKLTVTNIIATKNRIKVKMELEINSDISDLMRHDSLDIRVSMNDMDQDRGSGSRSDIDNGKILIEEEIENEAGYPEKGVIRVDAVCGKVGLNGTLKIPVDFTDDYKMVITKDISKKANNVNGTDFTIEKFESNVLETSIVLSQPEDTIKSFKHSIHYDNINFLVNVDGNLYYANYPAYSYSKDGKEIDNYCAEALDYDKVKDADKISIRQITNTMTGDEIDKFYDNNIVDRTEDERQEENGIKYSKEFDFNDGTKGNINAVREDNKIKIYCSSDSDFKSMIMAINLYGSYTNGEEYLDELTGRKTYKDKEKDNQYVVEFDDTLKDKTVQFEINSLIKNIDKYSLGDEIQVK